MLSFKEGTPIAVVKGKKSKFYGKVVNIKQTYDDPTAIIADDSKETEPIDVIKPSSLRESPAFAKFGKKKKESEYSRIYRMLKRRMNPLNPKKDKVFSRAKNIARMISSKEFSLAQDRGFLVPIPDPTKEATRLYISGPSGCGKSTFLASWIKQYQIVFPDNDVYLFKRDSAVDPAFDKIDNMEVIDLEDFAAGYEDDDGVLHQYDLQDFENSLVVFDDTSAIRSKEIRAAVRGMLEDMLENGRKKHISVAVSNHITCNREQTRLLMYEADRIVMFPHENARQTRYVCRDYLGMDNKKDVSRLMSIPSRWVLVHKNSPRYVLHQKGVYVI